ncbi:serine/threonine protein kinase [Marinomonas mediterranea]|jgi:Putative homoserine kinase type II (protein kinase fold)|uniref:Stress response kinase A n=1 Tax=Marinomonas mediterranea (strain ATCC 700492 / JCM 21426 / NBRC 103028 / MMB-1) TaxID=717774 RepID=F2K2W1_MARM1|nr:serine/threonine protein kinase [Marinomonas mediterranea]ADZ92350.1 aminoglycoside phosphotransferase [Marinomonas mediterranea MMB-1]WCN14347.1 serine/threonine protein kinase [Marinomonas mediterranea]WCN18399.1 serine/threonine protein kinase [Marinomonas mediterranea MMB-1]
MHSEHPFSQLIPDVIIDAVESSSDQYTNYQIYPLNSYENRVYQVGMEDGPALIAKFYRPDRWSNKQILEEHTALSLLEKKGVPVAAPLAFNGQTLFEHANFRLSLTNKVIGNAPEAEDLDDLFQIGELIGETHSVLTKLPLIGRQSPSLIESIESQIKWLLASPSDVSKTQTSTLPHALQKEFITLFDSLMQMSKDVMSQSGSIQRQTIHGDCHASNLLKSITGMVLLDFDDIQTGYPCQDIWLHLTAKEHHQQQLSELIEGYESHHPFDRRSLALIDAFKLERTVRYAAWLSQRWNDPAFPKAFPWFGTQDYWLGLRKELIDLKAQWRNDTE